MKYDYYNMQVWRGYGASSVAIFFIAYALTGCRLSISDTEGDGATTQSSGCTDVVCDAPAVCVEPDGECRDVCDNDIPCVNNDPCQTIDSQASGDSAQLGTKDSICGTFTCNAGGFLSCQLFDPCMIDSCDSTLGCTHESVTEVECAVDEICVSEIPLGSNFQGRLGDCAKRCMQDGECDDGDECTNDVCELILQSESPTEGLCANAVIDACMLLGACCTSDGCFELSETNCMSQNIGEVYQGDGTTCDPSPCFGDFVPGSFSLTGDCFDDGSTAVLVAEANMLILRGLPLNNDILLTVSGAMASAIDVVANEVSDQNASLAVLADGSILLDISLADTGTSCRSTMTPQ